MKFEDYIIKESFDKVGKQLLQLHKQIQKAQKCEDMKKVVMDAQKLLKGLDRGLMNRIELFFKDYREILRKISIDLTLNLIGMIQYISMNTDNEKEKEQLSKEEKNLRDNDYVLKKFIDGSKYDISRLIDYFDSVENSINSIIRVRNRVMK